MADAASNDAISGDAHAARIERHRTCTTTLGLRYAGVALQQSRQQRPNANKSSPVEAGGVHSSGFQMFVFPSSESLSITRSRAMNLHRSVIVKGDQYE